VPAKPLQGFGAIDTGKYWHTLEWKFLNSFPASSVCLSKIKPWDDATFDQAQVRTLIAELDAILIPGGDRSPPAAFTAIRQFIAEPPKQSGLFLKFCGD